MNPNSTWDKEGEISNVPGNDTKERPTPSKLITMTNSFPEPTNEYPGEKLLTGIEVCLASRCGAISSLKGGASTSASANENTGVESSSPPDAAAKAITPLIVLSDVFDIENSSLSHPTEANGIKVAKKDEACNKSIVAANAIVLNDVFDIENGSLSQPTEDNGIWVTKKDEAHNQSTECCGQRSSRKGVAGIVGSALLALCVVVFCVVVFLPGGPGSNNTSNILSNLATTTNGKADKKGKHHKEGKNEKKERNDWDVCLEWNAVAIKANIMDHSGKSQPARDLSLTMGPPGAARAMEMQHASMFQAYNCVKNNGKNYQSHPIQKKINCSGASEQCAVAQAVHDVMCGVNESPKQEGIYQNETDICTMADDALNTTLSRAREVNVQKCERGVVVGHHIAREILIDRAYDGYGTKNRTLKDLMYASPCLTNNEMFVTDALSMLFVSDATFPQDCQRGRHLPSPEDPMQGVLGTGFGLLHPFDMTKEQLLKFQPVYAPGVTINETTGEPAYELNNTDYVDALKQVKKLGLFRGGDNGTYAPHDDETFVIANVSLSFEI